MVRRDAARGLGEIGTSRDVPKLNKLKNDPHPEVRQAAAEAVAKLKSKK